jgi:hypothetical protein
MSLWWPGGEMTAWVAGTRGGGTRGGGCRRVFRSGSSPVLARIVRAGRLATLGWMRQEVSDPLCSPTLVMEASIFRAAI